MAANIRQKGLVSIPPLGLITWPKPYVLHDRVKCLNFKIPFLFEEKGLL